MRKLIFSACLFIALGVTVSSCMKNNSSTGSNCTVGTVNIAAPDSQVQKLKTYLDTNGIDAYQDSRGFFYTMDSSVVNVDSPHATNCSYIAISYKGTFLNGTTFDSSNNQVVTFPLSNLITGWQEAIPKMKKNASITLYVPPYLAYGEAGAYNNNIQVIPGNVSLIFYIKLYDYSN